MESYRTRYPASSTSPSQCTHINMCTYATHNILHSYTHIHSVRSVTSFLPFSLPSASTGHLEKYVAFSNYLSYSGSEYSIADPGQRTCRVFQDQTDSCDLRGSSLSFLLPTESPTWHIAVITHHFFIHE